MFFSSDLGVLVRTCCRSGVGAPVVGECEGEYHHDSRKNILEWTHPVIDPSNKSGSMEFSMPGHPDDFFPVSVSFVSKKSYCDLEVCTVDIFLHLSFGNELALFRLKHIYLAFTSLTFDIPQLPTIQELVFCLTWRCIH